MNAYVMSESIEVQTFTHSHRVRHESLESDIEEYEEVSVPNNLDKKSYLKNKNSEQHDFFINHNFTNDNKFKKNKKKFKKNKSFNDLLSSELALIEDPVEENVFINADWFKHSYKFIHDTSQIVNHNWREDAETGNNKFFYIKPKYPQILENVPKGPTNSIQYMPATTFNEFTNNYEEVKEERVKIMNLELNGIKFENFYGISLKELLEDYFFVIYNEYKIIQRTLSNVLKELKINRATKENFKKELLKISSNKDDIKFDPTLRKSMSKLILLKEKYIENIKWEKITRNKLECLFSDIEMLNYKNNNKQNGLKINIHKILLTDEEFDDIFNEIYNNEYSDLLDKIEYEYVTEYIEYKKQKYEENVENKSKIKKPKLKINEIEIRDVVEKNTEYQINKERISINIINENNKKQTSNQLQDNTFTIQMFVDEMFVCQSEPFKLDVNSDINFMDIVSIQIMPKNKTLTLKICDNNEVQASYDLDIIDLHNNSEIIDITLNFNIKIEPTDKYIGCSNSIKEIAHANGVRLKSSNIFKEKLCTKCKVNLKINWNIDSLEKYPQDILFYFKVSKTLSRILNKKVDQSSLKEIIEIIYDEDDIKNNVLTNMLNKLEFFTYNKKSDSLIDENLFDTVRFKLIHLRNLGEFSDIDNDLIAINSNQISTEQLNFLQDVKNKQENISYLNKGLDTDMIHLEIQRYIGVKYTQNINKRILKILNDNLMRNSYKDIVHDFRELSLRSLFLREIKLENLSIFGREKSNNKEQVCTNNKEVDIFVTILRAFNLPDRSSPIITEEAEEEVDDDNIAGFKMRPLRPFVRLTYQDCYEVESVTAIGCHPTWNQTLRVKAKTGSATILQINVFDKVKINISRHYTEDTLQSKTLHYRYYNKWLGSLTIPLYAVLNLGKLEGTFKINIPPYLLGYESTTKSYDTNMHHLNSLIKNNVAVISLQITSNFPHMVGLSHSQPIPAENYFVKHINDFITTFENDFPMRRISLTLIDSSGHHKSVTHFLQPLPPPNCECFPKKNKRTESAMSKSSGASKSSSTKSMTSTRNDVERSATPRSVEKDSVYSTYEDRSKIDELSRLVCGYLKYVSLIPTYEVNEQFNVTLNGLEGSEIRLLISLELLKILHGSPLDHTLLLASYYLQLGIKCWVVAGVGLPRGLSHYVLIQYDVNNKRFILINDNVYNKRKIGLFTKGDGGGDGGGVIYYLLDASSGEKYELRDISCPLKTVHYVFDDENIWVNIQPTQKCESVSFDFMKSSNWRQVFDKTIFPFNLTPTIENVYSLPIDVENLRQKLEDKIKLKIQKWRPHMKTVWHRYCSSLLYEVLPQWEYWNFTPAQPKPGLGHKLKQLALTYKMYGSPQHFPFSSVKKILSWIKSTGVHVTDDPDTEFGLAVQVFSYPNTVVSVWIFLVSMTRVN